MKISIIVAASQNNVIGRENDMPWHISEDLKRFKRLTDGLPIIMGRKTYESLPYKPLPKRRNIIISRQENLSFSGAEVVKSPEEALSLCKQNEEVFIIGGGTIYKHFIASADNIFLTRIHKEIEGDTFFPVFDETLFTKVESEKFESRGTRKLEYTFIDYTKI